MPGKKCVFTARVEPVSPPCAPRPGEEWWRRRVLPPGPQRLFHAPFIAIAGKPAAGDIGSRAAERKGAGGIVQWYCSRSTRTASSPPCTPPEPPSPRPGTGLSTHAPPPLAGGGGGRGASGMGHCAACPPPPDPLPQGEGEDCTRPEGPPMPLTAEQYAEIDAARAARAETRRPTVPALEALLFTPLPVLDHGFVRVIDYMGDDAAIVQAARVSYGRGTQARVRRRRADPLPDAPPPLDPVRDVRDQIPRETADLRRPPVDPPPHRQRERILRPLFDPGPRVLPAGARTPGRAIRRQPPGPRRRAGRHRGGAGAWTCCAATPPAPTTTTWKC